VAGREADWASTWWPGPAEEAVHGSRVAGRRQGAPGEHQWGPGVASGKEEGQECMRGVVR
jgi:hypothetical protein